MAAKPNATKHDFTIKLGGQNYEIQISPSTNYGWFHVIEEIADRDVTKFDAVIKTQASTIFAHLSYKIDYAQFQKQLLTKK